MRKVKIYGTLGPACKEQEIMRQMFLEGMDGVRLNLSHIILEDAADILETFHKASYDCDIRPELLIDMQGPELRIGNLKSPIQLTEGNLVAMDIIPFPRQVQEVLIKSASGQEVLLDDGKLLIKKEKSVLHQDVLLRVVRGGVLRSRKSIALPGCKIQMPAMTDTDRIQIQNAKSYGVTAVMQPFVRGKEDLIEVREALSQVGCHNIRLLAKIESMAGIAKLREVIKYCDEVVIARGDMGNAMELWELPAAQKRISAVCRKAGKDFMVVTQMLDSMIQRPIPSRAEVSDIFNAVLDGASSVMVTEETATGKYPALVIRYLSRTVREAEAYLIQNRGIDQGIRYL